MKYNVHKSSIGNFDANWIALSVYLLPIIIGWLIPGVNFLVWLFPIVIFFVEKSSDFVRFHSAQAFLIHLLSGIISVIFAIFGFVGVATSFVLGNILALGIGGIIALIGSLLALALFIFKIIAMVRAYQFEAYEIPLIGLIANAILNATR